MGDEPPYLAVGTEVSAKYRGAFCEAKIKKVVRTVKCKVTFKAGLGSLLVSGDDIKGTLRVGENVEARHPDKNLFIEAKVIKIQDCSQYTVIFDDGVFTTLKRSALVLRSGRHFKEDETLVQFPLIHPKNFSKPVVAGRKNVRERSEDISCVICFDLPKEAVLVPCGHYGFCLPCCANITECPICRIRIQSSLKLYNA